MATPHPQVEFPPRGPVFFLISSLLFISDFRLILQEGKEMQVSGGKGQRGSQSSQFSALSHHFFLPVMWEENPEPLWWRGTRSKQKFPERCFKISLPLVLQRGRLQS